MAGRLQESYANLERKVEARTQELHQRTDELGRSVGELRALGEVSQAVNSTLDLETVLSTIVAKAVPLSDTDAGAIYVYDETVEAPRIEPQVSNSATVLIVDDDPAARELLAANLKGAGYRLVHAASGDEALSLARKIHPDAITLDVMMPKPDGWDVLSTLKGDPELCEIPVIMVTVAPERGIGLSLGAVEVLTKPVDRGRLTALLNRLVRRDGPVLIVEDDADARAMMGNTVEKMGLAVEDTANGRLALSWLTDHPHPAVILLDLMMPEMDGFEFLDLAAREEWREIPVIVITARQLTAGERERLLRQARKVLEKATATRVDIASAIGEAIRRRHVAPPQIE